jgi:hypothetical protein
MEFSMNKLQFRRPSVDKLYKRPWLDLQRFAKRTATQHIPPKPAQTQPQTQRPQPHRRMEGPYVKYSKHNEGIKNIVKIIHK